MMENTSWTKGLVAAIEDVANSTFQHQAWLGAGTEMSSFVETYCSLYDDNSFNAFLAQPDWARTELNSTVRQEMILLDQLFKAYREPGSHAEILADPKWQEVVRQAQQVLRAMEAGPQNQRE
jgi:hypothetical protein